MLTETIELDDVKMIPELIKKSEDYKIGEICNAAKIIECVKGVFENEFCGSRGEI
ncbi:MAG: hypothetical protein QMC67_05690 [Candidatus Wallbacteria bacterium]